MIQKKFAYFLTFQTEKAKHNKRLIKIKLKYIRNSFT